MDSGYTIFVSTCAANVSLYAEKWPNLNPKDILQKMCLSHTEFDYDGISFGQYVDGMDAFFKDYRNKQLEVDWAIECVRDEVKGRSARELDAKVVMWRRCSAALHAGNTDQISKACAPDDAVAPRN
jgi:hypothetical protein